MCSTGDGGPATSASLELPQYIALDSAGNLYISTEDRIRKVTASTGIITTIAGNGNEGYSGDGIPAMKAEIEAGKIAIDQAGNLYFANWPNGVRPFGQSPALTPLGRGVTAGAGSTIGGSLLSKVRPRSLQGTGGASAASGVHLIR